MSIINLKSMHHHYDFLKYIKSVQQVNKKHLLLLTKVNLLLHFLDEKVFNLKGKDCLSLTSHPPLMIIF